MKKSPSGRLTALVSLVALASCGKVPDGTATTTAGADVPCDVAHVLESKCLVCHSDPPAGAPMPLVSYESLTRPALAKPSIKMAEECAARMLSQSTPMPPGGGASDADIAVFQRWIANGLPRREAASPSCSASAAIPRAN